MACMFFANFGNARCTECDKRMETYRETTRCREIGQHSSEMHNSIVSLKTKKKEKKKKKKK